MGNGKRIKLAFLTRHGREMPSSRVRAYNYVPYLEEMGFNCRVQPYPAELTLRAKADYARKAVRLAHWADLVVLQRLLLKEDHFAALSRLNRAIIFDFDEAIYLPPDSSAGDRRVERAYAVLAGRLEKIIGRSSCVITGSGYLADYARRFNDRVFTVPNSVDTGVYRPRTSPGNTGTKVVGWIGSPDAAFDFRAIGDLGGFLDALRGRAVLKIVGARPELPDSRDVVLEGWSLNREMEYLHGFDIGIMPLNDTERGRGRCSYKAIQYMGVGIPMIASPVGGAREVVVDRSTGLFAATGEEWVDAVSSLVESDQLRDRLGSAGYQRVRARYSYEVNAPVLAEIFKQAHGLDRRPAPRLSATKGVL